MREAQPSEKKTEYGEKLAWLANQTVRVVGAAIFVWLTYYALRYTQYMAPQQGFEFSIEQKDSVIANVVAVVALIGICFLGQLGEASFSQGVKQWAKRIVLSVSVLYQGLWGLAWIGAADRCPKGDQESVYKSAVGFFNNDFHALKKGSYCGLYPHQLGLASIEEFIFRIFRSTDYHIMQYIYVLLLVGIVLCVYKILETVTEKTWPVILGTAMTGGCLLPVFYTAWIYGEIPLIFCSLWAGWMLLAYWKRGKTRSLVGLVVAITLAMLVRKNALIMVVALALVAGVYFLQKRDYRILIALLAAILIPNLCYQGIFKMYELRSGIPHSEGLPSNDFVYIGLVETEGRFGWDFYPSTQVYYDNNKDPEQTKAAVDIMIAERWQEMRQWKGYIPMFFKGKVLSQWNAPLYQAMYFNYVHEEVHHEGIAAWLDQWSDVRFDMLLWWADRMQLVVYFGVLLYFICCVKGNSNLLQHLFAVTIIGGFLFSIIWEAKTRYVFPYYLMMFPVAVLGYQELLIIMRKLHRWQFRKSK